MHKFQLVISAQNNMFDLKIKDLEKEKDLPKLCFCISNFTAAKIIAVISILARITAISVLFYAFFGIEMKLHDIYYVATAIFILALVFDILLLIGTLKEKLYFVMPWFFVGFATAGILILIALFESDVIVTVFAIILAMIHLYLPFVALYVCSEINRTKYHLDDVQTISTK